MSNELTETLRQAQRLGFFGGGPIAEAIAHSQQYVAALGSLPVGSRIIDLGSGGGLPGLVLADRYRSATITLVDRRQKRTDFLRRSTAKFGWSHVTVVNADVADVVADVERRALPPFDVVTARGFGPPEFTLRTAGALGSASVRIVISEPPTEREWPVALLTGLGVTHRRIGAVSIFTR